MFYYIEIKVADVPAYDTMSICVRETFMSKAYKVLVSGINIARRTEVTHALIALQHGNEKPLNNLK